MGQPVSPPAAGATSANSGTCARAGSRREARASAAAPRANSTERATPAAPACTYAPDLSSLRVRRQGSDGQASPWGGFRMKRLAAVVSLALLICACALAAIATATASAAAPLNQYVVTHVNPKALGEGGFDRGEAAVPGKPGEYIVVATPSQANALRGRGAT